MSKRGAPKLPRLTDSQVLQLLDGGVYRVCLSTARIVGPKGKEITPHPYKRSSRVFVRLYGLGGVRTISRARLVWIAGARQSVPKGWEVHHRNECNNSDGWENLIAVHKLDHRKLHLEEGAPF